MKVSAVCSQAAIDLWPLFGYLLSCKYTRAHASLEYESALKALLAAPSTALVHAVVVLSEGMHTQDQHGCYQHDALLLHN